MVMAKRFGIFFLCALFVACMTFAGIWLASAPKAYNTTKVATGKAIEAVYATAVVEPVTWAAIAPIKTGRIIAVNVKEGDSVNTGDILARLDDADYRAHIREEQELARYYKDNLARSKKLLDKGFDSQEKYDARKTDLARTEARINILEEQIKQLALPAPMNGTVLWRDVELGEVKKAGAPIFWIGQPHPLRLKAEVDEEDIPKIKSGQNVLITADAFPGEYTEGLVRRISPKGDPINKSYRVYMSLPENTKLMIGMTVETNTIVQEKESALLVPAKAITEGPALWVLKNNQAHKTFVKTGIIGTEQIEILDGAQKDDHIILPPFNGLSDGTTVRVK